MKIKLAITAMVLLFAGASHSQLTFSVAPGLSMNGANFGYKINRFVPFIGLQYYGASFTYEYEHEIFDYDLGIVTDHNHSTFVKVGLIMPNLGVKYYFKEAGDLKANATLNLTKPIITGKVVDDEVEEDYVKDAVKGFSSFGGELSFGVEYFFDEHFSVGGDFGIRYLHVGSETSDETTVYNDFTGIYESSTNTYRSKLNATPTFSRISFNFYF